MLAQPDGERLLTDLRAPRADAPRDRATQSPRAPCAARVVPVRTTRRPRFDRAHPSAGHRRGRGADPDHPREQGAGVPRCLPAPLLRLLRPRAHRAALPRRRRDPPAGPCWLARCPAPGPCGSAGEELRLTYVALTRAQSQVVTWWGPSQNAAHSGLSRLLFGRTAGEPEVPERVPVPTDFEATAALVGWQEAGALVHELAGHEPGPVLRGGGAADRVAVRHFTRTIDTDWRRTSYSGLIRAEEQAASIAVDVEPEAPGTVDEEAVEIASGFETVASAPSSTTGEGEDVPSPMADLPAGRPLGRWSTGCSSTPTRTHRTCRPNSSVTSRSSAAGGRWTRPPTSWPRRCCRCSTPPWVRSPAACAWWTSGCPTGCASSTSSSRSSAATDRTGRSPRCTWG